MDHYRCYQCFIPSTGGTMNADTVDFFPQAVPFPRVTTEQYLHQAAIDLLAILQSKEKSIPSLFYGSTITNAYIQVAQILKRATLQPKPPTSSPNLASPTEPPLILPAVPPKVRPNNHASVPRVETLPPPSTVPIPKSKLQPPSASQLPKAVVTRIHDPYYKRPIRRPHPITNRHSHFTRSRLQGFLAQAAIHSSQYPNHTANHVYHPITGAKLNIDKLISGPDKDIWTTSLSNELGRCA